MVYRRYIPLLCLVLLMVTFPVAAQESPAIQLEVQPFFNGTFRPGSWLPMRVTATNNGHDVVGSVSVQIGSTYEVPLDLPQGARKSVTIYTRPTSTFRPTATVRMMVNGAEAAKTEVQLLSVGNTTRLIGVLTTEPLVVPLPAKSGLRYEAITLQAADLPERGEGLSTFDVLVIDGAPFGEIQPQQQKALIDWVMAGGKLLIGGDRLQATLQQLPEALRIASIGEPIDDASSRPTDTPIPGVALTPVGGARVIDTVDEHTTAVQQNLGKGQIALIGFSLSDSQLVKLPADDSFFWQQAITLTTPSPNMPPEFSSDQMRAEQLAFALSQLPTLAMPPLGLLAGMLMVYVLIVGPGSYVVLRRLDRQAWGWLAIPVATIIFSAGAYGYALRLRGNDIILNQINIVEPLGGRMLVQTFGGVFSPHTQTYAVRSDTDILFRPLTNSLMGGMPIASSSGSHYQQTPATIRDLSVAQWSMSSFAADSMIDGAPLEANLALADNVLRGEVHNTGSSKISGLALVQFTRVAQIGDLQPGERRTVEMNLTGGTPSIWDASLASRILQGQQNSGNRSNVATSEITMREAVLNAIFSSPFGPGVPSQPTLVGWLEEAPITLNLDQERVQHQQLTLLTMTVDPIYPAGQQVSLPRGWLMPSIEASSNNGGPCTTSSGIGWYADTGVLTTTLQLPAELHDLQPDNVAVYGQTDGPDPKGLKLSIYDWIERDWIDIEDMAFTGKAKELDQPARFHGPNGTFQFRTDLTEIGMQGFGCMSLDLSIEGTQP